MSRATSIAGVRPLGWLARLRAQRSCLAWASAQRSCWAEMARALRGWGQSQRWAWERAINMRVSARGPGRGWCRRIPLHAPRRWRQAEARERTVRCLVARRRLGRKIVLYGSVLENVWKHACNTLESRVRLWVAKPPLARSQVCVPLTFGSSRCFYGTPNFAFAFWKGRNACSSWRLCCSCWRGRGRGRSGGCSSGCSCGCGGGCGGGGGCCCSFGERELVGWRQRPDRGRACSCDHAPEE